MKGDGEQRRGEQKSNNHTIALREETGGGGASCQQQRRVDVVGGPEWDAGDAARRGEAQYFQSSISVDIEFLVVPLMLHFMHHRKRRRMRPLPLKMVQNKRNAKAARSAIICNIYGL